MTDADTVREFIERAGAGTALAEQAALAALDALVADRDAWIKAAADNGAAQDAAEKERDRVLGAYHRENDGRLAAEAELEVEKKRLREMQPIMRLSDDLHAALVEVARLREAATKVADAYTAEAEDHNDGEFALWKADDLVNAIVALRAALGEDA